MCLSACSYNPPEGWTKKHHTYEEVLEFAKTIATTVEAGLGGYQIQKRARQKLLKKLY